MNEDNWKAEAVEPRSCVTCGGVHTKGTYGHPSKARGGDALEVIAPGQRIPYMKGAAVVFGLLGMAEAINSRHPCIVGRHFWMWSPRLLDDVCERCGMTATEWDKKHGIDR